MAKSWMWAKGTCEAAETIHNNLLNTVLFFPSSFFDATPYGRIINRFSKDTEVVDTEIPEEFGDAMAYVSSSSVSPHVFPSGKESKSSTPIEVSIVIRND